jgi:FG-GAP-like repeat
MKSIPFLVITIYLASFAVSSHAFITGIENNEWSTSPYNAIDVLSDKHETILKGDFNGDGKQDIARARSQWHAWHVSLSTGTGFINQRWDTGSSMAIDWLPDNHEAVLTGDFNGDGKTDIATSRSRWNAWRVFISTGAGFIVQGWSVAPSYSIDWRPDGHEEIVTGDFNNDGKTDIATSRSKWGGWRMFMSNGSGFLTQWWSVGSGWSIDWRPDGHEQVLTGDFNGDGRTDIATSRSKWGGWRVFISTGNGFSNQWWATSPYLSLDWRPDGHEHILTGDFNGDGKTDIAHARSYWYSWHVSLSTGSGFSTTAWSTGVPGASGIPAMGSGPDETIVAADFDGDKLTDIVIPFEGAFPRQNQYSTSFSLFNSNGNGFQSYRRISKWRGLIHLPRNPDGQVIVGDFTGDGKPDIAHSRSHWGFWEIFRFNTL